MARDSVKLSDVAKAAGVSQGTASNVFSRPEIVRAEVREHVHATARAMGYGGPDPKGRLLRAGKVNAIGVATAEPLAYFFDDPFARELLRGISEACDKVGAGIALVSARRDERLAWNIQSALVDGFVLLCIENGEHLVQLTRDRTLPFVARCSAQWVQRTSQVGAQHPETWYGTLQPPGFLRYDVAPGATEITPEWVPGFETESAPIWTSMVPELPIAPPVSATPLRLSVLVASTFTVPRSVMVLPVTVVPSSVSVAMPRARDRIAPGPA